MRVKQKKKSTSQGKKEDAQNKRKFENTERLLRTPGLQQNYYRKSVIFGISIYTSVTVSKHFPDLSLIFK